MKSVFFFLLLAVSLLINGVKAQVVNQSLPAGLTPRVGVTILSDGKPTNQREGIRINTKDIRFRALLDTKSNAFFNDFKPEVLIKKITVTLSRNGRLMTVPIDVENTPVSAINFLQDASSGDHINFQFTLLAQRKNGELVALPEKPSYNFPIIKGTN